MLGTFQQSRLRIEVNAQEALIREAVLSPQQFTRWLWPQQFSPGLPNHLEPGLKFMSWVGPVGIQHEVIDVSEQALKMRLAQGIDGIHEWYWGDGWIQSSIEGISLLPINLGQTLTLLRLRQFLEAQQRQQVTA